MGRESPGTRLHGGSSVLTLAHCNCSISWTNAVVEPMDTSILPLSQMRSYYHGGHDNADGIIRIFLGVCRGGIF